jgi:hypothetical protein
VFALAQEGDMTLKAITMEQLQDIMAELTENEALMDPEDVDYIAWMRSKLENNIVITMQQAMHAQQLYFKMINRQFMG